MPSLIHCQSKGHLHTSLSIIEVNFHSLQRQNIVINIFNLTWIQNALHYLKEILFLFEGRKQVSTSITDICIQ